jgi:hypothetical protein
MLDDNKPVFYPSKNKSGGVSSKSVKSDVVDNHKKARMLVSGKIRSINKVKF